MSEAFINSSTSAKADSSFRRESQQQPEQSRHDRNQSISPDSTGPDAGPSSSKHAANSAAVTKGKQTKSRNGCITCKLKRLKCDEKKPGCDQCAKRNVTCGGYKKDFKWRPFEEQNVSQIFKPQQPTTANPKSFQSAPSSYKRSNAPAIFSSGRPDVGPSSRPRKASGSSGAKSSSSKHAKSARVSTTRRPDGRPLPERSSSFDPVPASSSPGYSTADPFGGNKDDPVPSLTPATTLDPSETPFDGEETEDYVDPPFIVSSADSFEDYPNEAYYLRRTQSELSPQEYALWEAQSSPQDMMQTAFTASGYQGFWSDATSSSARRAHSGPQYAGTRSDLRSYFTPPTVARPETSTSSGQRGTEDEDPDDDVEEISRVPPGSFNDDHALLQNQVPLFPVQNWDQTAWVNHFQSMVQEPQFASNSVEMLVSRFDRRTCGIMSIKDGPTENPWRTLFLPLMHNNKMIFNALMAMACLHSAKQEPHLFKQGERHFKTAFKELQLVARNGAFVNLDISLAAMLGLAFGESWGWTTSSGIDYIKISRQLMYGAIQECNQFPRDPNHLDRVRFLCRTWIYIDVIARLTSVDDDEACDFETISALISGPLDANIDPLMGCAGTLFPIVGRVANLVRRVCKVVSNPPELITEALNLKVELELWQPPFIHEVPKDESTNVGHSFQTAEAYRWATLLYLHQAVPEIPSLSSADLAHQVLISLAAVPLSSRVVIVQIYPLLAAGCEAYTPEDRSLVQGRWTSMEDRMGIGNVDRCAEVVREVWKRRDEYELKNSRSTFGSHQQLFMQDFDVGTSMDPLRVDSSVQDGRRATFDIPQRPKMAQSNNFRRASADSDGRTGMLLPEFTVRGKLHWVGVMKDWKWEVLLG